MKRKFISLILAVAMAVCFIPCAARSIYGESEHLRIVLESTEIHAGSEVHLRAKWDGEDYGMVEWTLSGGLSEGTMIRSIESPVSTIYLLRVGLDESAETLTVRATSTSEFYEPEYTEVTLNVMPPQYITALKLSNAIDATFIDPSMTVGDATARFRDSLKKDYPGPNEGVQILGVSLCSVPEDQSGPIEDWSVLESCPYNAFLDADREYYFKVIFATYNYYYFDNEFNVTYNGYPVDHFQINQPPVVLSSLDVYVKADMGFGEEVKVFPFGIKGDIDVSGNTITVAGSVPMKAGYCSDEEIISISAVENGDGTHSFVLPEGVSEVILVLKGDADLSGEFDFFDVVTSKAMDLYPDDSYTLIQQFAADVDSDDEFGFFDVIMIKAADLGKTPLSWL